MLLVMVSLPGTGVDPYVTTFMDVLGHKAVKDPCGVFAPG